MSGEIVPVIPGVLLPLTGVIHRCVSKVRLYREDGRFPLSSDKVILKKF